MARSPESNLGLYFVRRKRDIFASRGNRRRTFTCFSITPAASGMWTGPIQAHEFSLRTNEWKNEWKAACAIVSRECDPSIIFRYSAKTRTNPAVRSCRNLARPPSSHHPFVWFKRRSPRNKISANGVIRAASPINNRCTKREKFRKYRYIYRIENRSGEVLFFSGSRAFRSTISIVHSSSFKLGLRGAFSPATGVLFFSLNWLCVTLDRIFPCHARRGWQIYSS